MSYIKSPRSNIKKKKEAIQNSLRYDSQTKERIKPPYMIIKSKIDVIRFHPTIRLRLNFFEKILYRVLLLL